MVIVKAFAERAEAEKVLDIALETPAARQISMVSAPVRALVATGNGFWASTGRNATPTNYLGL